uniref:Uncharacterized protein n=1 Tax=Anopheles darlingi TaxID=43151 RepID=A0A2M4D8V9_ANODA
MVGLAVVALLICSLAAPVEIAIVIVRVRIIGSSWVRWVVVGLFVGILCQHVLRANDGIRFADAPSITIAVLATVSIPNEVVAIDVVKSRR